MSADDDRFDPRFDPAFQRGYSGPVPQSPAQPSTSKPLIDSPPPSRPQVQQPAPQARPMSTERRTPQNDDDDDLEYIEDTPTRRMNPFLIGLGAISLILIGGGLYLVSRMRDLFASTENQADFDFITMQVLVQLAPIIVSLGIATAIGVLFVFAVRWGRR